MGKEGKSLRVVHCPVNTAGVPWQNVEALRRLGVDAKLVVFERYRLHPEADWSLDREGGFIRRQLAQWSAFLRLLPKTDVFHFYFGLTLIPKSFQFPILRLLRKKSVLHFLGSDIRGRSPEELSYSGSADAQIVGSYDAIRWVPGRPRRAARDRPARVPAGGSERARAPTRRARAVEPRAEGHGARDRRLPRARRRPRDRRGAPPHGGAAALRAGRHRRRPAQRGLVRIVRDRGDGARQAGRDLAPRGCSRPDRERVRRPVAARARDQGDAGRRATAARGVPRGTGADRRREPRVRGTRARRRPERRAADRDLPEGPERIAVARVRGRSPRAGRTADLRPDHQTRQAVGDLRPRRPRIPHPRRPPPAALHELPVHRRLRQDRDAGRGHRRPDDPPPARDHERVLPLLLRRAQRRRTDPRRAHELLVHDDERDRWA